MGLVGAADCQLLAAAAQKGGCPGAIESRLRKNKKDAAVAGRPYSQRRDQLTLRINNQSNKVEYQKPSDFHTAYPAIPSFAELSMGVTVTCHQVVG